MVSDYKFNERLLSLMTDKDWVKSISDLKENEYIVTYKELKQKKNRTFSFHAVQFVNETQMFIFKKFKRDFKTREINDEVADRIEILITEVISYKVKKLNSFPILN